MASTNVSAIASVPSVNTVNTSVQTSAKTDGSGVAFKNLLNISVSSNKGTTDQTLQSKNTYTTNSNPVSRTIKQADTTKHSDSEIKDIENDITDAVVETVTNDLDITDEQLADIMQMLGITAIDLLQPDNLATFYAVVAGTDNVQDVILNSDFTNVLNDLSMVASDYSDQLQILSEMEIVSDPQIADTDILPQVTTDDAILQQPVIEAATVVAQTTGADISDKVSANEPVENQIADTLPEDNTIKVVDDENQNDFTENDFTGNDSKSSSSDIVKHSDTETTGVLHNTANETVFEEVIDVVPEAETSPVKIDTMDIIRQIAERVSISGTTSEDSTIEMQLNPENLGRIYINVTERNSEITARIAVSNEAVKEALETQMVELRETLNNSGIKVNDVEVTIASHEFEQNLEQNAASDEQRQNEQNFAASNGGSSIDSSSAGNDRPEEEILAQRIMKDNGNSVDFTA